MTREGYHKLLDEILDSFSKEVRWGSVTMEVKFENGREVLRIREHETIKPIQGEK